MGKEVVAGTSRRGNKCLVSYGKDSGVANA